jgi:chromosome segregation ATPase
VRSRPLPFLITLLALAAAVGSHAQVERSGGGVNAQLASQYQQAVAERTQLQTDNDKLKKDLDEAKKQLQATNQQLTALKSGTDASQAQLAAAQAASQRDAQALEQSRTRMQELVDRFRETAASLRDIETERSQLQQQLAQSKLDIDQCVERNYQLYQVDGEVLDRYEHQGMFSYMARAEPFTRIKRTQIENLIDEYRTRAEELRVQKNVGPGAVMSNPAADSSSKSPAAKP